MAFGNAQANIKAVITAEDRASGTLKKFGGGVGNMAKKTSIALAAVGATLTLVAKNATDFTVDFVKDSKKLAREIGVTTTESSKLLYASSRLGLGIEEVSTTFGIFSKRIVESFKASDEAKTSFEKLGINIKTASGEVRPFNDILLQTADRFKAMPDGIEKTALSMELFGRSGKDMIKFLNLGAEGISNLQEQADKLGITLTPKTLGKIEAYIESQKKLKENTDALKIAIGTATAPVLTKFNERLADMIEKFNASDGPMKNFIANAIAFGGPIAIATSTLITFGAGVAQVASTVAAFGLKAVAVFSGVTALIVAAVVIWAYNITKFVQNFAAIREAFMIGLKHFGSNFVQWGNNIVNFFKSLPGVIYRALGTLADIITAPFRSAFNSIASLWNRTIGKLSFKVPSWIPGVGGKGFDVPDIPQLAQGGIVTKPTLAMVGEKGPEAIVPLGKGGGMNNIIVNIGMYAGTEIEKRKIAVALMRSYNEAMAGGMI